MPYLNSDDLNGDSDQDDPREGDHICRECLQVFLGAIGYRAHDQLDNHRRQRHQRFDTPACAPICYYHTN